MTAVIRKGIGSSMINALSCISNPFLSAKYVSKIQVAGLVSKQFRDKDYKRPPPFNYKETTYGLFAAIFDKTAFRQDENSKLIIVDGPVASGKAKLAKELAEEFDMLHMPHANLDYICINSYGYDRRSVDHKLPLHLRTFGVDDFLANPKDRRAALLQENLFQIRFMQYMDALIHIFNTGQGVVMDRCVYSSRVFMETYVKHGFLPKTYPKYNNQVWDAVKRDLLQPHLIVYLDTPVEVVRENVKKRGKAMEVNSPLYQPEVLKTIEDIYKFQYLKEISKHAELLVYDNSSGVETEVVVEDMERVNLDDYYIHDPKMEDWRFQDEAHWNERRILLTKYRGQTENWLNCITAWDCEELMISPADGLIKDEVYSKVPGNEHPPGYNPELGDSVLFKA